MTVELKACPACGVALTAALADEVTVGTVTCPTVVPPNTSRDAG